MVRRTVISLLIWMALSVPAAGQSSGGGFHKKATRTLKTVDNYLIHQQTRQTTDTSYIWRPQEKWLFRTRSDVSRAFLFSRGLDQIDGVAAHLASEPRFKQNIGIGYRGFVIGIGGNPFQKSSDKEFAFRVYKNRFGVDLSYGILGSLQGDMSLYGMDFAVEKNSFRAHCVNLSGYYAFNWRRFSMPAAMNQSYIQRRSAGSPLATAAFRFIGTGFYRSRQKDYTVFNTRSVFFGVGGGYGYNWVPSEHWLLHLSVTETLGLAGPTWVYYLDSRTRCRSRFPSLLTTGNIAVIYYYKRLYAGAYCVVDNIFFPLKDTGSGNRFNIGLTRIQGHFTIGFRI